MTEVVVTMKAPSLSSFGRSLFSASHASYLRRLASAQAALTDRIESTVPAAHVRWHYRLVADGVSVVLPKSEVSALSSVPGVAEVWPNVTYHALAVGSGVQQIGADQLWGSSFETAGNGMKIGIIDDGLDATNPYFDSNGFQYPPGFPKGQTKYTTAKVIVQRTFAPPSSTYKNANLPFDPAQSFHATHVAGIAAGDYGTQAGSQQISGVAPNAYLGNYKALTTPTPGFGLDGNSAEIAAAIEAAVADGMNVINLSLGEPEIEPSRDLVVKAIDGAAAAGVVPVIAAGNDYDDFGLGSISSPGNAPDAITVAAATSADLIADFSSAGPTPVSLGMKPDVTAPGVDILSSLPASQGTFGLLSGTSMATPHVAGAAALLEERHPTWTVAQIKSALVQTGTPVLQPGTGAETSPLREGGGLVDLPQADNPLLFASPTSLSFGELAPGQTATREVTLTDAGGGGGTWNVSAAGVTVPATVTVPGTLTVTATAGQTPQNVSSFVVLSNGTETRRIPFWFATSAPKLGTEPAKTLTAPGTYTATTAGGASLVSTYRFPTGGEASYPGPERVFRYRLTKAVANFGVVVTSGHAVPHVVIGTSEDRLAGYPGLPVDLNPYRKQYGVTRLIAGAILPAPGLYSISFDTTGVQRAGKFTFRFWVNDTTPPRLRVTSRRGAIVVTATDAGSGVDPGSIEATLDGHAVPAKLAADGTIRIAATPGRHTLSVTASDYQETKNMEDVGPILPNTATLRASVVVR
jgi:subtilisin family serine protease